VTKKPIKIVRGSDHAIERYPLDPLIPHISSGYFPGVYFFVAFEASENNSLQSAARHHGSFLYEIDPSDITIHDDTTPVTTHAINELPPVLFNSFDSYWISEQGGVDSIVAKENAQKYFYSQLLRSHAYLSLDEKDFWTKFIATPESNEDKVSLWTRLFWNYVRQGQYQSFFSKLEQLLDPCYIENIHLRIREDYLRIAKTAFPEMANAVIAENNTVIRRHGLSDILERNARVTVGDHGIYIEFHEDEIPKKNLTFIAKRAQYDEYRDASNVKYYFQTASVNYASYLPGKWYIDIYDFYKKNKPKELTELQRATTDPTLAKALRTAYYSVIAPAPTILDMTLHDEKTILDDGTHSYQGKKTALLRSIYPFPTTQKLIERYGDSLGLLEVLPDPAEALVRYAISNGYTMVRYATYDFSTKKHSLFLHETQKKEIEFPVISAYYAEHSKKPEKLKHLPRVYLMTDSEKLKHTARQAGFECSSASGYGEVRFLMSLGYDGMIRGNELIVFKPYAFVVTRVKEIDMEKKNSINAPSLFEPINDTAPNDKAPVTIKNTSELNATEPSIKNSETIDPTVLLSNLDLPIVEFNSRDYSMISHDTRGVIFTSGHTEGMRVRPQIRSFYDFRTLPENASPMTYARLVGDLTEKPITEQSFKNNNPMTFQEFLNSNYYIINSLLKNTVESKDAVVFRSNGHDIAITFRSDLVCTLDGYEKKAPSLTKDAVSSAGYIPKDFNSFSFHPITPNNNTSLSHTKGVFVIEGKDHDTYQDFPIAYKSLESILGGVTSEYSILQKLNLSIQGFVPRIGNVVDTKNGLMFQMERLTPLYTRDECDGEIKKPEFISLSQYKELLQVAHDIDESKVWVGESPMIGKDKDGNLKFFDFSLASIKSKDEENDTLNYSSEKTIAQKLIDQYLEPDDARWASHERAKEHAIELFNIRDARNNGITKIPELTTNGYVYRMLQRPFDIGTYHSEGFVGMIAESDKIKDGFYALIEYSEPLPSKTLRHYGLEFDSRSATLHTITLPVKKKEDPERDL